MTSQEQQLIEQLFQSLRQQAYQAKDADADAAIRQHMAQQPDAAYWLAQRVLILEQALQQAQQQLADLQNQPPRSGFLPSNPDIQFGRGNSASFTPAAYPANAPAPAPANWRERWFGAAPNAAPAPMPAPASTGGSFLGNAAASAAGVAGGMLLFNGLNNMFGHHPASSAASNNWDAASNSNAQHASPADNTGNSDGLNQLAHDAGRDNVDQSLQANPLLDDSYGSADDDGGDGGFFGSDDDFA